MATAAAVFDPRVEAAVRARYGVWPEDVTLRRLAVLLRALPPGWWPEEDHEASWSMEAHLLATVVDVVNNVAWTVAAANSKRPPKRPRPMDRPGRRQAKRGRSMSWTALAQAFGGGDG